MGKTGSVIKIAGEIINIGEELIDLAKKNIPDFRFERAEIEIEATEVQFVLTWNSIDFDIDNEGTFEGLTQKSEEDARRNRTTTDLWKWKLHVFEDAGISNDEITIDGWVKHVYQPHDRDTKPGEKLTFRIIVSADDSDAVKTTSGGYELRKQDDEVGKIVLHPSGHNDELTKAEIEATITSTAGVDDFTSYTFKLEVNHISAKKRGRSREQQAVWKRKQKASVRTTTKRSTLA